MIRRVFKSGQWNARGRLPEFNLQSGSHVSHGAPRHGGTQMSSSIIHRSWSVASCGRRLAPWGRAEGKLDGIQLIDVFYAPGRGHSCTCTPSTTGETQKVRGHGGSGLHPDSVCLCPLLTALFCSYTCSGFTCTTVSLPPCGAAAQLLPCSQSAPTEVPHYTGETASLINNNNNHGLTSGTCYFIQILLLILVLENRFREGPCGDVYQSSYQVV